MNLFYATILPRLSLSLAIMACIFMVTSRHIVRLEPDFPNCISIRLVSGGVSAGFVSIHGLSTAFVGKSYNDDDSSPWSERRDGHFCGFLVPPYGFAVEPPGFNIHLSTDAISWTCPYWLMVVVWGAVFFRGRSSLRFSLADLFLLTAVVALVWATIRLEIALPIAILLNLATALLLVFLTIRCIRTFFHDDSIIQPLLVKQPEAQP
jgi:hypothetical protein